VTSFDSIYKSNNAISKNRELLNKPDNIYYFLLFNYLEFAISVFSEYSYVDLSYTPFDQEIYVYSYDVATDSIVLETTPPTDCKFYIKADGLVLGESEYTYDDLTNTITFTAEASEFYIGAYIIGEFLEDIPLRERMILANAMTEWFVEGKVNDDSQLEQVMYSDGIQFSSQASHNKANLDIEKFRHSKSFSEMIIYSYGRSMPKDLKMAVRGTYTYND
jgi:hypothetical protein